MIKSGINYVEVANEAAFYGPKIDVQVWSAIGREFTIATNQADFAVPAKFGLTYRDKDNWTPLCIHRGPLGTHKRFIGGPHGVKTKAEVVAEILTAIQERRS